MPVCRPTPTTTTVAAAVLAAGTLVLAGCGSAAPDATSGPASTATTPTTSTPTTASPTPTTPPAPEGTPSTPPPSGDPAPIPTDPRAYAQDFVVAWARGDTGRGALLATPEATKEASAVEAVAVPRFSGCEGAAGSTSCTFTGDEYTMVVRVRSETASAGRADAVSGVQFRH